jgi:sporulation protein YlmC with PRC-barrel domain
VKIDIGARVRTRDDKTVGEVHRVVVDLDNQAVVSLVVLEGRLLSRDVLVPIDFIESSNPKEVTLRLAADELDQLPDFVYNEILAPPPAWTLAPIYPDGTAYVPIRQRKRLGRTQVDLTPGTRVWATDGEIGRVDEIELDEFGELDAFWVRANGIFAYDVRIPAEWIARADESGIYVHGGRADIEAQLAMGSLASFKR